MAYAPRVLKQRHAASVYHVRFDADVFLDQRWSMSSSRQGNTILAPELAYIPFHTATQDRAA